MDNLEEKKKTHAWLCALLLLLYSVVGVSKQRVLISHPPYLLRHFDDGWSSSETKSIETKFIKLKRVTTI